MPVLWGKASLLIQPLHSRVIQRLWFPRFSISDVCICQDWDIGRLPNSFQQALGCKNIIWPGNCSYDWLHFPESFPPPLLHNPLIPVSLPRPSDIQHQSEEWVFFYMSRQSFHTHKHTHTHTQDFPHQYRQMEKSMTTFIYWKLSV